MSLGIGKSRLLYEFRQSLEGKRLTYLTGRCLSYGSTTPYLPVLEVLRHHCGITETDRPEDITAKIHRSLQEVDMAPEEWAPVLLHLLGSRRRPDAFAALSPEARKARTLTAVTQMCLNGSRQPLILEIEDLHWIDASSDECLTALVERMAGAALLVLVTYRPGYRPAWIDKSYVTQVSLQPLTAAGQPTGSASGSPNGGAAPRWCRSCWRKRRAIPSFWRNWPDGGGTGR